MRINFHGGSARGPACSTKIEHVGVKMDGEPILDDICLQLHCGETTAIMGPNGAGKSTLIRAILGEIPHTGDIRFHRAYTMQEVKPRIGYVPQMPRFDAQYPATVADLFVACTSRSPVWLPHGKRLRAEIAAALREVDMEDALDKRVGVLSGGELQRVLLALAMRPLPQILLLDEPSSGIDSHGLHAYYETVERVKSHTDLSVLLISHDPALVEEYADRAILLNHRILRDGRPEAVLGSPEYKALLG